MALDTFTLLRQMRRGTRRPQRGAEDEEVELLDEAEQRAIVERFEAQAQAQSRLWRRVFSGVGAVVSAVLVWAALRHAVSPWHVVFHAPFYNTLAPRVVCVADLLSAAAIGAASHALLVSNQLHLRIALAAGVGVSLFWASAWWRLYRRRAASGPALDVFKLLWLPLAPLYSGVCLHVDASLQGTDTQVRRLKAAQYAHKSL